MTPAPEPDLAVPPTPALRRQHSLLSRVVAVVGLSFFAVEVVILAVFTGLYGWTLRQDRIEHLGRVATAAHGPVRATLLAEASRRADDDALDADLDAALEGGRSDETPRERFVAPAGPPVRVYALTERGSFEVATGGALVRVEDGPWSHLETWPPAARAALAGGEVAARLIAVDGRLARIEPLPLGGTGAPRAALVVETSFADAERQVASYALVAFATGGLAILATALVTLSALRRFLLLPLSRLVRADNAARRGEVDAALIDEGDIPDDEVGAIMRSRNRLLRAMITAQRDLDRTNAELAEQREELRRWGRELERHVEEKTGALLRARDTLYRTEKLAAVGRLAANVAHEINNPLASIAGYAEAAREELEAGGADGELAASLQTIEEQAYRCKDILKRLLTLARSAPAERAPVDLAAVVRDAASLIEPALRKRGVHLEVEVPADAEGPLALADVGSVEQVILNLVENAADAAVSGGAGVPTVWVAAARGADEVGLTVEDNGRGVPADVRDRVFDSFVTTKPVGRGTGLGLAISQSLVERLGGRIELRDPVPGRGAVFAVWLQPASAEAAAGA